MFASSNLLFTTTHQASVKTTTSYPLLNFLKGGRMTLRLFTTQCRPTRTLARSPRMMQSFMTMVWRPESNSLKSGSEPPRSRSFFLFVCLLCHSERCFDSRTELTVCSPCCPKPEVKSRNIKMADGSGGRLLITTASPTANWLTIHLSEILPFQCTPICCTVFPIAPWLFGNEDDEESSEKYLKHLLSRSRLC